MRMSERDAHGLSSPPPRLRRSSVPSATPGTARGRRRARHGHPRLGLLQSGEPGPEAGGLARAGAEGRRHRGPVGAEPGLQQGAGVPQCRQPRFRLDRGSRSAAGQGQRQPDRDRLGLLQARVDGAGHPARHRHRQGRGPQGQADRGHQGHRPVHLPAARPGRARAERRRTSAWSCCSTTRAGWPWSAAMSTPGPGSTR